MSTYSMRWTYCWMSSPRKMKNSTTNCWRSRIQPMSCSKRTNCSMMNYWKNRRRSKKSCWTSRSKNYCWMRMLTRQTNWTTNSTGRKRMKNCSTTLLYCYWMSQSPMNCSNSMILSMKSHRRNLTTNCSQSNCCWGAAIHYSTTLEEGCCSTIAGEIPMNWTRN